MNDNQRKKQQQTPETGSISRRHVMRYALVAAIAATAVICILFAGYIKIKFVGNIGKILDKLLQ